jgi:branched-subunit amino acid aminotransferase/4-amino-4-deoxychorismate lyase
VIAYVNGQYLPHEQATISIDDRAVVYGDAVFDVIRTFGQVPFKLDEHLDRLRHSLRYIELDPDPLISEVALATEGVLSRNQDEIAAEGDVWIYQIVTRGRTSDSLDPDFRPTVIVKLRKLNFSVFGPLYKGGVDLHVSLLTSHFAASLDPRVKGANRLAAVRAELKGVRMRRLGVGEWAIIFSPDGSISETQAANVCIVSGARLIRPKRRDALEGVSLEVACELARGLGMDVEERPLFLYDVLNADETLLCGTSFSILPVNAIDGIPLRRAERVYPQLVRAWIELVGMDFVAQAEERAAGVGAAVSDKEFDDV